MTPMKHYTQFANNLTTAIRAIDYSTRSYKTDRSFGWGNGQYLGWLHVVPVSGYSNKVARVAICHYSVPESRWRNVTGDRGELSAKIEISVHCDELLGSNFAPWLAQYIDARHRGAELPPPPYILAEHGDYGSSYFWSRLGYRQVTVEHLRWPCNAKKRAAVMQGELKLPNFSDAELADPATFDLRKEV